MTAYLINIDLATLTYIRYLTGSEDSRTTLV